MEPTIHPSEQFLRFRQRKMITLLAIILVVGAIGLALVLTPGGPVWRSVSRASLIPLAIAIVVAVQVAFRGRRWSADSPEVKVAMQDEWLRSNMDRASRLALVVALLAQYPLALMFATLFPGLPQPRPVFAMAFSTITLALATQLGVFLYLDRE